MSAETSFEKDPRVGKRVKIKDTPNVRATDENLINGRGRIERINGDTAVICLTHREMFGMEMREPSGPYTLKFDDLEITG